MQQSFDEFLRERAASGSAPGAVSEIVTRWQPGAAGKIAETLGLSPKSYAADLGFEAYVDSWEGPGAPNIAWLSGMLVPGADLARASVTTRGVGQRLVLRRVRHSKGL